MTDTDSKLSLSNTSTVVALEMYLYLVDISLKHFQVSFKDGFRSFQRRSFQFKHLALRSAKLRLNYPPYLISLKQFHNT